MHMRCALPFVGTKPLPNPREKDCLPEAPFLFAVKALVDDALVKLFAGDAGARGKAGVRKRNMHRPAAGRRSTWVQTSARSTVSQSAHLRPIARLARRQPCLSGAEALNGWTPHDLDTGRTGF